MALHTLDHSGHVPLGHPSGFGGAEFITHLEGQISSVVPVPAAVWLFGTWPQGNLKGSER